MQSLKQGLDLDGFFKRVASAGERVLFLDYDGTLAPFRVERDLASPYPGVRERLDEILKTACRVVIVSGRSVDDLIPLLGLSRVPEIWGAHGWERRRNGALKVGAVEQAAARALDKAEAWADSEGLRGRCERKHAALAVHWRGMEPEDAGRIRTRVLSAWTGLAAEGLVIRDFDGGIELRVAGKDKGEAVRTVISEMSRPVAAYLGDDDTDEDAFEAVDRHGLAVLVRPELRDTRAALWVRPPEELLAFLESWREALK